MVRCQCRTKLNKRCLGNSFIHIVGKNQCIIHARYNYLKPAIIIQTAFRSYKMRRAIKIYKKLPDDIQFKILFYMQENELIKNHHHKVIENVLGKRIDEVGLFTKHGPTWPYYHVQETLEHVLYAYNTIDLCTKYHKILHKCKFHGFLAQYMRYAYNTLQPPQTPISSIECYRLIDSIDRYYTNIYYTGYSDIYNHIYKGYAPDY